MSEDLNEINNKISFISLFFNVISSCIGSALFFGPKLMASSIGSDIFKIFTALSIAFLIMASIQQFLAQLSLNFCNSKDKKSGILYYFKSLYSNSKIAKYFFIFLYSFIYISCSICIYIDKIIESLHIDHKYGNILILLYFILTSLYIYFSKKNLNKINKFLLAIQTLFISALFILLIIVSVYNNIEDSSSFFFNVKKTENFDFLMYLNALISCLYFFDGIQNFTFLDNSKFKIIRLPLFLGTLAAYFIYFVFFALYFLASPYECMSPDLKTTLSSFFSVKNACYIVSFFSIFVYSFPIINIFQANIKTLMFEFSDNSNNENQKTISKIIFNSKNLLIFASLVMILIIYNLKLANLLITAMGFTYFFCIFVLAIGAFRYKKNEENSYLEDSLNFKSFFWKNYLMFIIFLSLLLTITCIVISFLHIYNDQLVSKLKSIVYIKFNLSHHILRNNTLDSTKNINLTEICP